MKRKKLNSGYLTELNNPTTLNKKSGPSTVLDANEEKEIEQWIFDRAKMGIPVTKDDLLSAVKTYVTSSNKNTPFIIAQEDIGMTVLRDVIQI